MDLLRQTALSTYEEYENSDETGRVAELKIVRILAKSDISETATFETEDTYEANIVSRVISLAGAAPKSNGKPEHCDGTAAELLLVSMWTSRTGNASEGVGVLKACFLGLIDALDIDRCVLQPIVSNTSGFVEYSDTISSSLGKSNISTYFLANAWIQLIWSFNFATSETKAILITRRDPSNPQTQNHSRQVVADFLDSLRQQRVNIFSPYTLLFITLVQMSTREYKSLKPGKLDDGATTFENKTEYGAYSDAGHLTPHQKDDPTLSSITHEDLAVTAKYIETTMVSLASDEQQMDLIDSLLDTLSEQSSWRLRLVGESTLKRRLELCERDMSVFSAVLRPLRQQNAASRSALKYMAARTRGQEQTMLALRAQEDARLTRAMASTTQDLVQAAKRDASSMKTIAVMTMAFLPGTFFAALFAMPLLRWDAGTDGDIDDSNGGQQSVISERFWVYWVFTLPVTAFVFLIWLVLNYDEGFRTAFEEYQRRKNARLGAKANVNSVKDGLQGVGLE
ncbi:hypothetical protein F5Y07DRAFT_76998 [Xylaria sp. FL0933]|nr:hypothetical protein F5Y07DRAFT_76998 [Xylaria sp. FL0933]